jgi:hypothetical protein
LLYKSTDLIPSTKMFPNQRFNWTAWELLRVSVSAQPSEEALVKLLHQNAASMTVIDVRQESHGFVNGGPITWMTEHNWGNISRSHDDAMAEEERLLTGVKNAGEIEKMVFRSKNPADTFAQRGALEKIKVKSADSEQFVVESHNARYVRLTIPEGLRPADEEVDRLIETVRILPDKGWIHVHDRMENTRANLVSAMVDMLKNSNQLSFDLIVARQNAFLMDKTWSDPNIGRDWSRTYAHERRAFLEAFYRYTQANPSGQPRTWTEWLALYPK